MDRLSGKVAVITGGASGIGEATAKLFTEEGARVMIVDLDAHGGARVAEEIRAKGGQALFVEAHVEREEEAASAIQRTVETFGRLDILVNNAAMRLYGPVTEATEASWDRILAVNLKGYAFCAKAAIPEMHRSGGGTIVNVSSVHAVSGRGGMAQYDVTKAGILALTRSLAVDHVEDGIRVNAICPGPIFTQFHEKRAAASGKPIEEFKEEFARETILKRPGLPREVAYGILFLASDESSYVTGTVLMMDGGWSAI
ncbi:MAG: SDR family oxidoreductase [candidate division NC10 bacterium]|nr:SDR family oxidoreductase [candidate division NC10 bacterium]